MNTVTNGFKECGKAARCADPEIDDNLRANLREQGNMSAREQTRPRAHERGAFDIGGYMGKDIKGMCRNDLREVRDYGNAVTGIGSLVGRCVNGRGGMRKSRGRVRM